MEGLMPGAKFLQWGFPLRQTHFVAMEFHEWRLDLAGDLT